MVCSDGDELAEVVRREELGAAVAPGDDEALAVALAHVLDRGKASYDEALARVAARYAWPEVAKPLIGFLQAAVTGVPSAHASRAPVRSELGHRARSVAYRVSHRAIRAALATARRLRLLRAAG